jgi:L-ascorbate metabolism protein UlaG (beta-lactamase superfamily)
LCGDFSLKRGFGWKMNAAGKERVSDHFDGKVFFNPGCRDIPPPGAPGEEPQMRTSLWRWLRFILHCGWKKWPDRIDSLPGKAPAKRVSDGSIVITPIGHATFLIQLDGVNILTDPIWSDYCGFLHVPWTRRHRAPGVLLEDLPGINAVLVSHNHYDHLDIPTLTSLAKNGVKRSITALGNSGLIRRAGIASVDELDWWQQVRISKKVTVTLVPAQHCSSRGVLRGNMALWGGFVISGPSGNIYFAGDSGYCENFRKLSKWFSPIRAAILPISPYMPGNPNEKSHSPYPRVHMRPEEAIHAHIDLGAETSIASHFQVFQLGVEGFEEPLSALKRVVARHNLRANAFIAPLPGQSVVLN